MEPFTKRLTVAVVLVCASLSAWAEDSQPGEMLIAPELAVASDGPITAIFLGASQPFDVVFSFNQVTASDRNLFGREATVGTQSQTGAYPGGTNVTFGATFGVPNTVGDVVLSATAAPSAQQLSDLFNAEGAFFNAGVIQTGPDSVLIGFSFPFGPAPMRFDAFGVRIAASNVCVR